MIYKITISLSLVSLQLFGVWTRLRIILEYYSNTFIFPIFQQLFGSSGQRSAKWSWAMCENCKSQHSSYAKSLLHLVVPRHLKKHGLVYMCMWNKTSVTFDHRCLICIPPFLYVVLPCFMLNSDQEKMKGNCYNWINVRVKQSSEAAGTSNYSIHRLSTDLCLLLGPLPGIPAHSQ